MSEEIASIDRVRDAADTLRRRGVSPTADRIVEMVGGSKSTVLSHLRTLRAAPTNVDEVPAHLTDLVKPALAQIYRHGREAEAEKTRAATEVLSRTVDELDAQIAELAEQNVRLEQASEKQSRDLHAAAAELERLTAALAKAEAENVDLKSRAKAGEVEVEGRLSDTLSKIESLLASTPASRKTISMPDRKTGSA